MTQNSNICGPLYFNGPKRGALVFGVLCTCAGIVAGFCQGATDGVSSAFGGAILCGFFGLIAGVACGTLMGTVFLSVRVAGQAVARSSLGAPFRSYLAESVRRPDVWALALQCLSCGWRTYPEGPYPRKYCLRLPTNCPRCDKQLFRLVSRCPYCEHPTPQFLWSKSWRRWLCGESMCRRCGCEFDRWGRVVRFPNTFEVPDYLGWNHGPSANP